MEQKTGLRVLGHENPVITTILTGFWLAYSDFSLACSPEKAGKPYRYHRHHPVRWR